MPPGRAATFLRSYLIGSAVALLLGFVFYTQWLLHRLEANNRALVEPLARLAAHYPSISDREESALMGAIVSAVAEHGRVRFIIADAAARPLVARGFGPELDRKLREDAPLTPSEDARLRAAVRRMSAVHGDIPVAFVTRARREIGRIYYADVDASELADMPLVLSDMDDQPIAWRIYNGWETALSHPRNRGRATAFIRDARHHGRVRELQVDPPVESGTFYYELLPLRALQWMPFLQLLLVGAFVWGGVLLYRRAAVDEQAAIWAGLAKESAHQLGTPVSSLMGWLDVLREGEQPTGSILDEMEHDVARLERVVGRFSQVGQAPVKGDVDVNAVVREAAGYFRGRLPSRAKRIEIVEACAAASPVWGNADLLQWVLENLIRNALDAIEASTADVGVVSVSTRSDPESRCVTIEVRDSGGGVPRSLRRRIFAPGFTTKRHGWGVGLTLARRIVETYHGGRIRLAESSPVGSVFEVRLPCLRRTTPTE
jgi:signal transduction histidine kinase